MPQKPKDPEYQKVLRRMGERIRDVRLNEARLTQAEFARLFGHSHSWIAQIEKGNNGIDAYSLWLIADRFGYPMDWFCEPVHKPGHLHRPRTRIEWEALYPENPQLARALFDLTRLYEEKQ